MHHDLCKQSHTVGHAHGRWFWRTVWWNLHWISPRRRQFKKRKAMPICGQGEDREQRREVWSLKMWKRLKMHDSSFALTIHRWSEELYKSASHICTSLISCIERQNANTPNQATLEMCASDQTGAERSAFCVSMGLSAHSQLSTVMPFLSSVFKPSFPLFL